MRFSRSFLFVSAGLLVLATSSCSQLSKRVTAFERGTLSKSGMALMENPKETMAMNHMFNAREGSVGGLGGAGGGCGCN